MKRNVIFITMTVVLAVVLMSCNRKDDPAGPVPVNYMKVAETETMNSAFSVEMYAKDSLFVGYNPIYFKIRNKADGKTVNQATIALHPLMDMVTFKHACPFEDPGSVADAQGLFKGAILFSMPGENSWSLDVDVTAEGLTDSLHFDFAKVRATNPVRKIVVIDSLEATPGTWTITKYPISLVLPPSWSVGINPFEITIHKMAGMMSFPAVTDMDVEITPEMPSMGHGSPNNVNPVHTANGHYKGSVNFTMTGDWRIHLTLRKDGRLITKKAYFDIIF